METDTKELEKWNTLLFSSQNYNWCLDDRLFLCPVIIFPSVSKFPTVWSGHHMIIDLLIYFTVKNVRFGIFLIWYHGKFNRQEKYNILKSLRNRKHGCFLPFFFFITLQCVDCLLFCSIIGIISVEWEYPYNKWFFKFSNA